MLVKTKTVKLLEENTAVNLCDLWFDNDFLHRKKKNHKNLECLGGSVG